MSSKQRFVILGADAAGMSAAAEARRVNPDLEIIAFDRGRHASYSQCGMPYLLGGLVAGPERLVARTVEQFAQRDIAVRLEHEALAIDPATQTVFFRHGETEAKERYDHLLIATGADPLTPDVSGLPLAGVFALDVMEDVLAINTFIRTHQPRRAVIVGGGYVGLETAENLRRRGLEVAVVQRREQVFTSVDVEIAVPISEELTRNGVDLSLCDSIVRAVEGEHGRVRTVHSTQGEMPADLVLLAVGVHPQVGPALTGGVELGFAGAIAVDDHLRTNVPDIYAAGDCAEHWHRLLRRPTWVPLGTTANKQGRIAGRNIAGGDDTFGGIVGTAITRVFTLEVGRTGLSCREADAAGIETVSTTLRSTDHAGYLPDAQWLTIKVVAEEKTGKLLGVQAVGLGGVDKRIDVAATALYADLTLEDITRLDLEYAPPFNSTWDPLQAAATSLLRQGASSTPYSNDRKL